MAQPVGVAGNAVHAPPPKPIVLPQLPASGSGLQGALGRGLGNLGAAVHTGIVNPFRSPAGGGSDAATSGPGYGSATADLFKQTPEYKQAVIDVFNHQSHQQQQAILEGASRNPTSEGKLLAHYVMQQAPHYGGGGFPAAVIQPAAAIDRIGGHAIGGFVGNVLHDVWNVGPGTVEGLYALGKYALTGEKTGGQNGFQMLVDPYIQLFEHPGKSLYQHPLNSLLLAAGPENLVGRGAGFAMRTGAFGERARAAASTMRPDLHIGTIAGEPSPFTDSQTYSRDILRKGVQVGREKAIRAQGRDPFLVQPSRLLPPTVAYAMHRGIQARLYRGVDEMTLVHQLQHRSERTQATNDLQQHRPSEAARNVVAHILQTVIRSPQTAKADALAEADRLEQAQRDGLVSRRSAGLDANRRQIADLRKAANTPGALDEAFKAAEHIRPILHTTDSYLVAHGMLDHEQALRARLFGYAIAHMGAKPGKGLDAQFKGDQAVMPGLEHPNGARITTQEILDHIAGWRDVPNPEHLDAIRAAKAAENNVRLAHYAHQAASAEHQAASAEHSAATASGGRMTAKEALKIANLERLAARPGTPGEGAAARGRIAVLRAKIAARGNADPRVVARAQERLRAAQATLDRTTRQRAVMRRRLRDSVKKANSLDRTVKAKVADAVPDPAFVEHTLANKTAPWRFYHAYKLARGLFAPNRRSGAAFQSGAYDHTWNGLVGQVAHRAEAMSKASLHDAVITRYAVRIPRTLLRQLGIRSPNGDFTPGEARAIAEASRKSDFSQHFPNALRLVPISRAPAKIIDRIGDLQNPRELNNVSQLELKALRESLDHVRGRTDSTRNVVLIPEDVAKRFEQQYARTDTALRNVGRFTQQFRRTVLPYSTHWMAQIATEAGLRALIAGALHPRAIAEGRVLTDYLETDRVGQARLAEIMGGTHYNNSGSSVMDALRGRAGRGALDIHSEGNRVVRAAKVLPITRQIIAAHNRYADTVTAAMYGLEHNARMMGLGQLAHREIQSWGFQWSNTVKAQGELLARLAENLKSDPALTARFGREIDNLFGKYGKFTPMQRAAIQSVTPFLPWYLNAAKYVFWHLPAHHPVASSLMASLRTTIDQDIKDGKTLPLSVYAMQELARLSPFGIFTPPSARPSTGAFLGGQQITGAVLPQIESTFYNLAGKNAFGDANLKGPGGDIGARSGPALAAAAENLLESFLPVARYVREVREGGRPSYGTSTIVSPQTKGGKGGADVLLNRLFNPLYSFERGRGGPAYGYKKAASSSGSSSSKGFVPGVGPDSGAGSVIPGLGGAGTGATQGVPGL